MAKPLLLIVQWFGPWPAWTEFFLETCKWNPGINWLIVTDQDPPANQAPNIAYEKTTFEAHKRDVAAIAGIDPAPVRPFKLCDLRPVLGELYRERLAPYGHYGHCDIDLMFGAIGDVYTPDILARHDALSTHDDRLSGHLAILRNDAFNRNAWRRIKGWHRKAADAKNHGIDEYRFGKALRGTLLQRLTGRGRRLLFEERYTTPMTKKPWLDGTPNYPTRWFWRAGRLTADGMGERDFIYLHFMNWKGSTSHVLRHGETAAPWSRLDTVVRMDWRRAGSDGFMISHDGIAPLPGSA